MERSVLSVDQLAEIESRIDAINFRAETLNPDDPRNLEVLNSDSIELERCISTVEQSFRNARLDESGFKLVK